MIRKIIFAAVLLTGCDVKEQQPQPDNTGRDNIAAPETHAQPPEKTDTAAVLDDTSAMGRIRYDARRRGIDFRAVGQEPGWLVEIDDGKQISILADYGEKKLTAPAPKPEIDEASGIIIYRSHTTDYDITIKIRSIRCYDAMSGVPYPTTVELKLNSTIYQGCGEKP